MMLDLRNRALRGCLAVAAAAGSMVLAMPAGAQAASQTAPAPAWAGVAVPPPGPNPVGKLADARRAADEVAVRQLARDILDMYTKEDMTMAAIAERIYTPDDVAPPIVVDMGETLNQPWSKGKAEWLAQIKRYIEMPNRPGNWQFQLQEPHFMVDENLAAMVALVPTSWKNSKGKTVRIQTRYTFVFLKLNGEWKLWHEHWSIPASPAALGL